MNNWISRFSASLLLAFIAFVTQAEVFSFRQPEKAHVLFGSSVNALLEDNEGYLWIGTDNGLFRYDGYELRHFDNSTPSHLQGDQHIGNLQEDASHHLWISTSNASQYLVLTPRREQIITQVYLESLGMATSQLFLIHIDKDGNLWRVTKDSVCCYDFATKKRQAYAIPNPVDPSNHRISVKAFCSTLYILDGRKLRTFSRDQNVWQEEELDIELPNLGSSRQTILLTDTYIDHLGGLWVYSLFSESILYRDATSMQWQRIELPRNSSGMQNCIRRIVQNEKQGIWIATNHRGLFLYQPETREICRYSQETGNLTSDNVNTLAVDSHHTLWLAYFKMGISYCQPRLDLVHNRVQQCPDITTLCADDNGDRWIGTDGRGLWHEYADGRILRVSQIPNITITDLQRDKQGNLWIATYDHGLYCVNVSGAIRHFEAKTGALPHDGIQRIAIDSENRLWACSAFGPCYCFDPKTEKSEVISGEEGSDLLGQSICYDAHADRILLGTFYGIWVYDIKARKGHRMLGTDNGRQ